MRIAVGMSGGVDSTMAAAFLLEQGHDVLGLTMSIWDGAFKMPNHGRGCYGPAEQQALDRARMAARRLGIPHRVIPVQESFRRHVLEGARSEYMAGRTPNPCVLCNKWVKFKALPDQAARMGERFDYFATGHYARLDQDPITKRHRLRRAVDSTKDQSYFLSRVGVGQLAQCLFPLGERCKEEIRCLAVKRGFQDLADQPESQDFLQSGDYSVLFNGDEMRAGQILRMDGRVLGRHRGLVFYTVGQRRGLGLSGTVDPLYVVRLDSMRQEVIVGPREALESSCMKVVSINWLAGDLMPEKQFRALVRIRHQHQPAWAIVSAFHENMELSANVVFDQPQWAIAPGQTAAFYQDDVVLGGGVIAQA